MVLLNSLFSLVVVAGVRLYTTTTSGLWGTSRFSFGVGGWLQAGCGSCHKFDYLNCVRLYSVPGIDCYRSRVPLRMS
jgi:hypothetical protein